MSNIGPQLPPHLAKRRRNSDGDDSSNKHPRRDDVAGQNHDEIDLNGSGSDSEDGYAPPRPSALPAAAPAPAAARTAGPCLPPHLAAANDDEIGLDDSDSDTGPAPPPAAASSNPNPKDSSDDEDDFGPSLPS
ncbi:hypothetical protein TARUN_6931, partial [Trichoderma arundinaceum]